MSKSRSALLALAAWTVAAPSIASTDVQRQVDELFAPWTSSDLPGCAVAATQDGRIVVERGYGMADLEQGTAIRPHTVFNMASVSKQFTATAILLLAQAGKLSLDDDTRKYVPELPDYGSRITLRQLGNHTSGLRDLPTLLMLGGWNWVDDVPMQQVIDTLARQKRLNFTPGSQYSYSNSGYLLMAAIVERVSGQSFGEYTLQNIFKPLGMLHTRFYDDRRMIMKNRAAGHLKVADGGIGAWRPTYQVAGDGALLTSVQDMVLWERNFLQPRLGPDPQQLIAQLIEPSRLNDGQPIAQGYGLFSGEYRGLRTIYHSGGIPGYSAYMLRFPEQRFSVQIACNQGGIPARKLAHAVAELYLQDQFKASAPMPAPVETDKKSVTLTSQQLAEFSGSFYSDEVQATHLVKVEGNALRVTVGYLPGERWIPVGADRFESEAGSLTFRRNGARKVSGYRVDVDGVRNLEFRKVTAR